jgi:hypothetical protein
MMLAMDKNRLIRMREIYARIESKSSEDRSEYEKTQECQFAKSYSDTLFPKVCNLIDNVRLGTLPRIDRQASIFVTASTTVADFLRWLL